MGLAIGSRMLRTRLVGRAAVVVVVEMLLSKRGQSGSSQVSHSREGMFRDGVEAAGAAGAAPTEPADRQPQSAPAPWRLDGFHGVLTTGRREAARRDPADAGQLVGRSPDQQPSHRTRRYPGRAHAGRRQREPATGALLRCSSSLDLLE